MNQDVTDLMNQLTAANAEVKNLRRDLELALRDDHHCSALEYHDWWETEKAKVEKLKDTLKTIANYKGDNGCCPYGCDSPTVAQHAVEDMEEKSTGGPSCEITEPYDSEAKKEIEGLRLSIKVSEELEHGEIVLLKAKLKKLREFMRNKLQRRHDMHAMHGYYPLETCDFNDCVEMRNILADTEKK